MNIAPTTTEHILIRSEYLTVNMAIIVESEVRTTWGYGWRYNEKICLSFVFVAKHIPMATIHSLCSTMWGEYLSVNMALRGRGPPWPSAVTSDHVVFVMESWQHWCIALRSTCRLLWLAMQDTPRTRCGGSR